MSIELTPRPLSNQKRRFTRQEITYWRGSHDSSRHPTFSLACRRMQEDRSPPWVELINGSRPSPMQDNTSFHAALDSESSRIALLYCSYQSGHGISTTWRFTTAWLLLVVIPIVEVMLSVSLYPISTFENMCLCGNSIGLKNHPKTAIKSISILKMQDS